MKRVVMVTAIQSFRIRYAVEVPDDVEEEIYFKDGTRSFPCTPEEWAMDTVTCNEAKEFTQQDMGEYIVDAEIKTLPEILSQFKKEEPAFGEAWDDETIIRNHITQLIEEDVCPECGMVDQHKLDCSRGRTGVIL